MGAGPRRAGAGSHVLVGATFVSPRIHLNMAQFSACAKKTDPRRGLELHCELGNWIVMPPLTSMLQVNRDLGLSVSTRWTSLLTVPSGTRRARMWHGVQAYAGQV